MSAAAIRASLEDPFLSDAELARLYRHHVPVLLDAVLAANALLISHTQGHGIPAAIDRLTVAVGAVLCTEDPS